MPQAVRTQAGELHTQVERGSQLEERGSRSEEAGGIRAVRLGSLEEVERRIAEGSLEELRRGLEEARTVRLAGVRIDQAEEGIGQEEEERIVLVAGRTVQKEEGRTAAEDLRAESAEEARDTERVGTNSPVGLEEEGTALLEVRGLAGEVQRTQAGRRAEEGERRLWEGVGVSTAGMVRRVGLTSSRRGRAWWCVLLVLALRRRRLLVVAHRAGEESKGESKSWAQVRTGSLSSGAVPLLRSDLPVHALRSCLEELS